MSGSMTRRTFITSTGRALGVSAAGAGTSALLASCGGNSSASGSKEIESLKFSNEEGPSPSAPGPSKWLHNVAKGWKAKTGQKIDYHYVPVAQYEASELQTEFSSGSGPDLFEISAGDFTRYYNGGVLRDLSPFMSKSIIDGFSPGVLKTRTVNGKTYGIPREVQPVCIFYSVKAFEEAHLSDADIPKTWDELLELGKRLTTKKRFGLLMETTPGVYQNFTWYPFMWMGGGDVAKNNKSTFNSPATVAALKFWQDAIKSGVAPKKSLAGQSGDASANIAAGYCAMQISGIWSVADLADNSKDFEYGIFRLPVPPGGHYETILGGWAWVANAKSPKADDAAKFIVWALSDQTKSGVDRVVQWDYVLNSNLPTLKAAAKKLSSTDTPYPKKILAKFEDVIAPGGRAEPRYPPQVWRAVSTAIQDAQLNGVDPAKAAASASANIDAFLKTYDGAPLI